MVNNSPDSHQALHRLDQSLRVVAHSILEGDFDLSISLICTAWFRLYYHQIGLLTYRDRTDVRAFAETLRP